MKNITLVFFCLTLICCSSTSITPSQVYLNDSNFEITKKEFKSTNTITQFGIFTFGEYKNVTDKILDENPKYQYLVHPIIETETTNFLIFSQTTQKITTRLGRYSLF